MRKVHRVEPLTRREGPFHDRPGAHVPQLGPDKGATLPRLDVLEVGDLPQVAVEFNHESIADVCSSGQAPSCAKRQVQ